MFRGLACALLLFSVACSFERAPITSETQTRLDQLRGEVNATPENPQSHYSLALAYEEAGLPMKAADEYHKATQLNPQHGPSIAALGRLYEKLGYYTAAYQQLTLCLRVSPNQPDCLYQIGALLQKDGSNSGLQQSLTYWRRFASVARDHPKFAEVRRRLNEVEAQLDTALDKPAAQVASPTPVAPSATIPGHDKTQNSEDVGQLNPFGAAIGKAIAAIRKKDSVTAEAAFRDALKIKPTDTGALAGLAETLFHQNKTKLAQQTITKAYDADPTNAQARWVYGLIMIKTGQNIGKALEAWEALNRDSPEFANEVGVAKTLEAVKKMRGNE